MAKRSKQAVGHGTNGSYLRLVRAFALRPIRSDVELDRAIAMIDSLVTRKISTWASKITLMC